MSVVTDIILIEFDSVGLFDGVIYPIKQINKYLSVWNCSLNRVDSFAGGNKCMQIAVWMAAINYLSPPSVLATVVEYQDWKHPESVRLMIKEEWDTTFRTLVGKTLDQPHKEKP